MATPEQVMQLIQQQMVQNQIQGQAAAQAAQQGMASVPTGLRETPQQGFMDMVRNPSQAQTDALIAGVAGLFNPSRAAPLSGLLHGASAVSQRRGMEMDQYRQVYAQEAERLKAEMEALKAQGTMARGISTAQLGQANLEVRQAEFMQRQQERAEQHRVTLTAQDAEALSPGLGQAIANGQAVVQRDGRGILSITSIPGSNTSEKEFLRSELKNVLKLSDEDAFKMAYGLSSVEVNEVTGNVEVIDRIKRSVQEVQRGESPRIEEQPPGTGLFSMLENATGVRSALLAATARIPGTRTTADEREVLAARQGLRQLHNDAARGLVHNNRFLATERAFVMEALDFSPKLFDTPDAMRARAYATDRFLRRRFESMVRDSENSRLPDSTRGDQAANAAVLSSIIEQLNVPQSTLFTDSTPEVIRSIPDADWDFIMGELTDEDVQNMPTEVLEAVIERQEKRGRK